MTSLGEEVEFEELLAGLRALNKIEEGGHPGIEFDFQEKSITFKHSERESASRALAKVKPTDNEKYTFRTWLTRLGMIGDEYKEIRKELLQNLSGNSAFRKGKKDKADEMVDKITKSKSYDEALSIIMEYVEID